MPVIVNSTEIHPFLPSLGDSAAIEAQRAMHQDIRPLDIAIINLMADKQTTEKQLAHWLGKSPIQVNLTFAGTDTYINGINAGRESRNTPSEHIRKFYQPFSAVSGGKYDGLIVTGVNALKETVTEEDYWPEVQKILEWSQSNVLSSLFLCWGAKAALKHFHDIDSIKGAEKRFGLFNHRLVSDQTGLLFNFPDEFPMPVSRWKNPDPEAVRNNVALEVAADSTEGGPNIIVESASYNNGQNKYARRLYVLSHPEYENDTLGKEYLRDYPQPSADDLAAKRGMPKHYFRDDDPRQIPVNSWRHTGMVYTNWVDQIYNATPYDIEVIPSPFEA